jgi:hypothetical protein
MLSVMLIVIKLSDVMLIAIKLSDVMLSVILQNVMAPIMLLNFTSFTHSYVL